MPTTAIPTVSLPGGETVAALGQGTWHMGESAGKRSQEIAALRAGLDLGMSLIDTAEMYAGGVAEEIVGEAFAGRREEIFVVSKVPLPENATRRGTITACERSLKRLKTDHIDLYLLHWRGGPALADTLAAFAALIKDGKIRHWGVSNFDTDDMEELWEFDGDGCATNQVLYNLSRRGPAHDLIPACRKRQVTIMAYSPIEQGRLLRHAALKDIATRHNATPAQIALAWLLRQDGTIVIPKSADIARVRENRDSAGVQLNDADLAALDSAFPPPKGPRPLEIL